MVQAMNKLQLTEMVERVNAQWVELITMAE